MKLVGTAPRLSAEPLRLAFRAFDPTQSGLIKLSVLKYILTNVGDKLAPAEFDDFRANVLVDEEGRISYEGTTRLGSRPDREGRWGLTGLAKQHRSCACVAQRG